MTTDLSDLESVLKDILKTLKSINDELKSIRRDELNWYGTGFADSLRKELNSIESNLD